MAANTRASELFSVWHSSGITLGAFATRLKVPIRTLIPAIVSGVSFDPTPYDVIPVRPQVLCAATHGPRGSIRWHRWSVAPETVDEVLAGIDADRGMVVFGTVDCLTVALNPTHLVTLVVQDSDQDVDHILDRTAVVPSQSLLSGSQMSFGDEWKTRDQEFLVFKDQVQQKLDTIVSYMSDAQLRASSLLGTRDRRAPRCFLQDMKNPFLDCVPAYEPDGQIDDEHHLWKHLLVPLGTRNLLCAFTSPECEISYVLVQYDQATVLECPLRFVERSRPLPAGLNEHELIKRLNAPGVFSIEEIDDKLAGWRAQYRASQAQATRVEPTKKRSRAPARKSRTS